MGNQLTVCCGPCFYHFFNRFFGNKSRLTGEKLPLLQSKDALQSYDEESTPSNNENNNENERSTVDFLLYLTGDNPLDASDVIDLEAARKEIQKIRKFASEYLDNVDENVVDLQEGKDKGEHIADLAMRSALYEKHDFASFRKISYEKNDSIRSLIYESIKKNVLFEHDTKDEILELIDAFEPETFHAGETVINQGDDGSKFYMVESGNLSIRITVMGTKPEDPASEVKVGDYSRGAAFGELALVFGSPRAATITATTDCKLWSIERTAYRSIVHQLRYEQYEEKNAFLKTCVVDGKRIVDILDSDQIKDLTIATKLDTYTEGQVILREGQDGDTFYIVRSGRIEGFQNGHLLEELKEREVFGTESLFRNVFSKVMYMAATTVTVYYLTRHDFETIIGSFQEFLDKKTIRKQSCVVRKLVRNQSYLNLKPAQSMEVKYSLELNELEVFNTIHSGAFGQVKMAKSKDMGKGFALKLQSKAYIIEKGQEELILNKYRIMKEMEQPFVVGMHCAMQDNKYVYFLLDLLPGGDLMSYLVDKASMGRGFTEDATRFYAASAVLAFDTLHPLMIAYRDLKPEDIVLNRKGYGVLVDSGLARKIDEGQTYTFCGTPDYLAPEIIRGTGHDWAVDYWALGVFLFEMTNGTAPFFATNQTRRLRKIQKGYEFVRVPSHFSSGLVDLIANLLIEDRSQRLGRRQHGLADIFNHHFFAGFDWNGFGSQTLKAPIVPSVPNDVENIAEKKPDMIKRFSKCFQEADFAPDTDWWPDLENMEER